MARLAAAFAGIHYSFTVHAKDIYHQYEEPVQLDLKIRDATFTVTVSDYNVDYLRTHFGAPTDRTHRIYNGLDLSAFPYHPPINRPSHVVAVGRLVEKKGCWKANAEFKWRKLIPAISLYAGVNLLEKNRYLYEVMNEHYPIATPKAMIILQSHPL